LFSFWATGGFPARCAMSTFGHQPPFDDSGQQPSE
jgi:hypothetical protein